MKFVPTPPLNSSYTFIGGVKLDKGENKLTRAQLKEVKDHPSYKYYCEQGWLQPSEDEKKPTGAERKSTKLTKPPVETETNKEDVTAKEKPVEKKPVAKTRGRKKTVSTED